MNAAAARTLEPDGLQKPAALRPALRAIARPEVLLLLIGGTVLVSWLLDLRTVEGGPSSLTPMKPNAAVALLLAAAALWLLRPVDAGPRRRLAGQVLAVAVVAIGAATLLEYVTGVQLGIDQLLFHDSSTPVGAAPAGRMGANSALALVLAGCALLVLDVSPRRFLPPAELLAVAAGSIALLRFTEYLYGVGNDEGSVGRWLNPMALNASIAFMVLAAGLLTARPYRGVVGMATGPSPGGLTVRRLILPLVAGAILVGWLGVEGVHRGLFTVAVGNSLLAVGGVLAASVLIVAVATSLDRVDAARRETSAELDRFFDVALNPLCITDFQGHLRRANPAFVDTLGYTQEALGSTSALDLVHPDDLGLTADAVECAAAGHADKVELRVRRLDGSYRWLQWSFIGDPENGLIYAAGRDVTEQRRSEAEIAEAQRQLRLANEELEERVEQRTAELVAANEELESFAYSVSHDLQQPLRAVRGFSEALLEDYEPQLDETASDYLRRSRDAADRMGELIAGLLKLSRISRVELDREPVDLSALAAEVDAELRLANPDRSVAFTAAPGLTAEGDPKLLRVVLANLLGNAWKFSAPRTQAIVELGATASHGPTTYFVRDNGVGFDPVHADRLFAPFQRFHPASEFSGDGIGLATVRQIVQRHGGRVWAESAIGSGTTISFTLGPDGACPS